MIKPLRNFSKALASLSEASGLNFIWHFTNVEWKREVCANQNTHGCRFCRKIKNENSCELLKRCIQEHHIDEFFLSLKNRSPFIIHCHAGAMELIIPLIFGTEFCGVLCLGTFRSKEKCGYNEYRDAWQELPEISESKLLEWGDFLIALMKQYFDDHTAFAESDQLINQTLTQDIRILRAVKYIRENYPQKLTVEKISQVANMSKTHFIHLFSKETGYTFSDFLLRVRAGNARKLVEGSDMPLSEIADLCGFSDQCRMGVLFRRYFNTAPGKMRQHYREKILNSTQRSDDL